MGQNGQEPVKQPGVGVGLADTEGKLKCIIILYIVYMYTCIIILYMDFC